MKDKLAPNCSHNGFLDTVQFHIKIYPLFAEGTLAILEIPSYLHQIHDHQFPGYPRYLSFWERQRKFWKNTVSHFWSVALRAAFLWLVVFVCVALRAASILKNSIFLYLINVLEVTKHFYLADLSIGSALERLVLKNDADCTSQRLKWTSGARFMIIFRRFTYKRLFSL